MAVQVQTSGVFKPLAGRPLVLPVFAGRVSAGFPSPADDFIEAGLDINEHLIANSASSFIVRVEGSSMTGAGIHSGDLLIVDRSIKARSGAIVIAVLDGELTVKTLARTGGRWWLRAENPDFPNIAIDPDRDYAVWGVVSGVVRKLEPR